jgi:AcrR family transcriptional regulator
MEMAIPYEAIPYESTGRVAQKERTRAAIVDAAVELIQAGEPATIEAAAGRAGVGRGTAYRYFPNRRALLAAAHPRATARSMLPPDPPTDPAERLRIVVREITRMTAATEPALRTMLRLSLDDVAGPRDLPLRVGRRLVWVDEALAPLAARMDPALLQALTVAIAAACGIEVYVWLKDIAGLRGEEAAALQGWIAEILLRGGSDDGAPPPPAIGATLGTVRSRVEDAVAGEPGSGG